MSYVLHIWDEPAASTVEEAVAVVWGEHAAQPAQNQKFVEFANALTAICPDDDEDSVWADAPLDGKTTNAVYAIGIASFAVDDVLLGFVADTAGKYGLHVLDMQAGFLYSPGEHRLLFKDGRRPPIPGWSAELLTDLIHKKSKLSAAEVRPYLEEEFLRRFSEYGWQAHYPENPADGWFFWRESGEIKQIFAMGDGDSGDYYGVRPEFGFSCERILEAIAVVLPEMAEGMDGARQRQGLRWREIHASVFELFGPEQKIACSYFNYGEGAVDIRNDRHHWLVMEKACADFVTWDELESWFDKFCDWFKSAAMPALSATRSISDLDRLIDTPWRHETGRCGRWYLHDGYFSLAVAYLGNNPKVDHCLETVFDKFRRGVEFSEIQKIVQLASMVVEKTPGLREKLKAHFVARYSEVLKQLRDAVRERNDNKLMYHECVPELVCTVGLKDAEKLHEQAFLLLKTRNRSGDYFSLGPSVVAALEDVLREYGAWV